MDVINDPVLGGDGPVGDVIDEVVGGDIGTGALGPVVNAAPSVDSSAARVDTLLTATGGAYSARGGGSVSVLREWLSDGVQSATGLTDTPVLADHGNSFVYRETATETGGSADGVVVRTIALGDVIHAAPTAAGGLADLNYADDNGIRTVDVSGDFTGEALTYEVQSGPGSINASGVYSIDTDPEPVQSTPVVIRAFNDGGEATSGFTLGIVSATITATIPPATSAISNGQAIQDMADYAAMIAPGNFVPNVSSVQSAVVSFQGDASSASDPLAEGEQASFSVLVTLANGIQANFVTNLFTVPYVAPVAAGGLADQTFTNNTGIQTYDVSGDFTGTVTGWSIESGPGSINSAGLYSVDTDALGIQSTAVVVRASNPGGNADSAFTLNIQSAVVPDNFTMNGFTFTLGPPLRIEIDAPYDGVEQRRFNGVMSTSLTPPSKAQIIAGTGNGTLEAFSGIYSNGENTLLDAITGASDPATYIHGFAVEETGDLQETDIATFGDGSNLGINATPATRASSYEDYAETDATSGISHTFAGMAMSSPEAGREVFAFVSCVFQSSTDLAGVTIGGVAATQVVQQIGPFSVTYAGWWRATVPTGATVDVVVTGNTGPNSFYEVSAAVYRAVGFGAVNDTAVVSASSGTSHDLSVNTAADDVVFAGCASGNGLSTTWTGVNEDYDEQIGGSGSHVSSGFVDSGVTAETPRTVTATTSAGAARLAGAAFSVA